MFGGGISITSGSIKWWWELLLPEYTLLLPHKRKREWGTAAIGREDSGTEKRENYDLEVRNGLSGGGGGGGSIDRLIKN